MISGSSRFGSVFVQSQGVTGRKFVDVSDLGPDLEGQDVWVRARCQGTRKTGSKLTFMILRQKLCTVQAVVNADEDGGNDLPKFCGNLSKESVVDILAKVTVPPEQIKTCTQKNVELQE